jgi:hypothetical protein
VLLLAAALVPAAPASAYAPVRDEALAGRAVRGVLRAGNLSLSAIPSCRGVGLTPDARTVGDFFGATLAQFANQKARDPILLVTAQPGMARRQWVPVQVTLHKRDGEEEWKWGLRLEVTARGPLSIRRVTCVVAG